MIKLYTNVTHGSKNKIPDLYTLTKKLLKEFRPKIRQSEICIKLVINICSFSFNLNPEETTKYLPFVDRRLHVPLLYLDIKALFTLLALQYNQTWM